MNYKDKSLEELRALVYKHNDIYYGNPDSPETISDFEYDLIFEALSEKESNIPVEQRLTSKVNAPVLNDPRSLVLHGAPMISIKTVVDVTETGFIAFHDTVVGSLKEFGIDKEKIEYIAEPKYDGLGLSLVYRLGKLFNVVTRGDGIQGQAVPQCIPLFNQEYLPTELLGTNFTGEIRGEGMMTKAVFEALNNELISQGKEPKKNPRNAVAGVVRASKPITFLLGQLVFFPYGIVHAEKEFSCQSHVLDWLVEKGFKLLETLKPEVVVYPGESPYSYYSKVKREELGIEIDGIVYKVNSLELQNKLGSRTREPRWAMAHKFAPEAVLTVLQGFKTTVGRTGVLTPVAQLVPVYVGGVTVDSCIMENFFHVRKLGMRVGSIVELKRSGDTIPKITSAMKNTRSYVPNIRAPKTCTYCNGLITREKGFREHYCRNTECPQRLVSTLKHFVSRPYMDIVGLGDKTIEELFNGGFVRYPVDFYNLSMAVVSSFGVLTIKDKLVSIVGSKLAEKIEASIARSAKAEDWRILAGAGFPTIGSTISKKICETTKLTNFSLMNPVDLLGLPIAANEPNAINTLVAYWAANPVQLDAFRRLVAKLDGTMEVTTNITVPTKGHVLLTGSFHQPRPKLSKHLSLIGWKTVESVNSKVNILVAGQGATQHKVESAKKSGIPVMTWDEFEKHIKENL